MSASSSCRSSSRARSRSPPLRTSAPTYVWPSSTWHLPRHLHRLSSSLRQASHLHPSPRVLNRTPGGASSGSGRGRRRRGGRGQGGSDSGSPGGSQWPSLLNLWTGSIHMWPGSTPGGLRHSSCSSTLWWPACLQPTTLRLLGHTTRCPPRGLILPGRQHHLRRLLLGHRGIPSPSPTPSAPSPSPRHRTPRTG